MHDNKVSENAIWEGSITPDNDTPSIGSQMQSQPQMMFCYKCNNHSQQYKEENYRKVISQASAHYINNVHKSC